MQPSADEKVRERWLRRAAARKGLRLRKSRRLHPDDYEHQKWWVIRVPAGKPELWQWWGTDLTACDGVTLVEAEAFVEAYQGGADDGRSCAEEIVAAAPSE